MSIQIEQLDHLVLTVKDLASTADFYQRVLGMQLQHFGEQRLALSFGRQKINLHQAGQEFAPHAHVPMPGSTDLCFITATAIQAVIEHLAACGVELLAGPVKRTGATSPLLSVYFRDPDLNLIEVANRLEPTDH